MSQLNSSIAKKWSIGSLSECLFGTCPSHFSLLLSGPLPFFIFYFFWECGHKDPLCAKTQDDDDDGAHSDWARLCPD